MRGAPIILRARRCARLAWAYGWLGFGVRVMRTAVIVLAAALAAAPAPAPASDDFTTLLMRAWCSSGSEGGSAPEVRPTLVEGLGNGSLAIAANAEAKAWFDYGLQSAWAFNHRGAVEAFKEAQRLDPSCAMCVWGEAWAAGP